MTRGRQASVAAEVASLYDATEIQLLGYLQRVVFCPHTAADLAAETYAQAILSWSSFRGDSDRVGWLFGIARNLVRSYWRRESLERAARDRLGQRQVVLSESDYDRIEQLVDVSALRIQVGQALSRLPEKLADAVRLRVAEELPYAEVARRLGCSEGAARVRVSRGLAFLDDELGMEGQGV